MSLSTDAARKEGFLKWRPAYLDAILIASVFVVSLGGLLFGEKIEAGGGFGYDGGEYANIAQHFETLIAERSLDSYRVQRILPSAIVHYAIKLLGVSYTPPTIVMAFGLLNVAFFTISAVVWCQIANRMNISTWAKLIGFIGLFVNFAVIKMASYYPVLTDNAAFMLGVVALYFYLIGSKVGLYLLIVAGAFTWPTVAYSSVLLALFPFPRSPSSSPASATAHGRVSRWLVSREDRIARLLLQYRQTILDPEEEPEFAGEADRWLAPYSFRPVPMLLTLATLVVLAGVLFGQGRFTQETLVLLAMILLLLFWATIGVRIRIKPPPPAFWLSSGVALYVGVTAHRLYAIDRGWYDTIESLLPLSYVFVMCYVFVGLFLLLNSPRLFEVRYWLSGFRPHTVLIVAVLLLGSNFLQSRLSGVEMSTQFVLRNILLSAIQAPGIFLVAHAAYFGPIVIVALLYWKQASGLIREFGGGLLLMACLALLFSLMSESRTIINFFPFFVMVSAGALDRQRDLSGKKVVLFALLSLLMSRVWLQIGDNHDLYYFMNFGPWMGRRVYYVFLVITIVATMLVYLLFKYKSNKRVLSVQELA